MSLKKIMLLFAAGSLVLAGCSDDNPTDPIPEDADDNFITSVVLTVGDNSYAAEIAGNDITVTYPTTSRLTVRRPNSSTHLRRRLCPTRRRLPTGIPSVSSA